MSQDTRVTRQDTSDGGVVWSASMPPDFEIESQRWSIHPDGHVRGYRLDLVQVDDFEGAPAPAPTLIEVTIQPVADPAPLPEPEEGEPKDLSIFPVPDDFLSEPEPGSTAC